MADTILAKLGWNFLDDSEDNPQRTDSKLPHSSQKAPSLHIKTQTGK